MPNGPKHDKMNFSEGLVIKLTLDIYVYRPIYINLEILSVGFREIIIIIIFLF